MCSGMTLPSLPEICRVRARFDSTGGGNGPSPRRRAARVAAVGEAWVNYFEADELRTKLTALGFSDVEDLGPAQIVARYFAESWQAKAPAARGGHIVRASTV